MNLLSTRCNTAPRNLIIRVRGEMTMEEGLEKFAFQYDCTLCIVFRYRVVILHTVLYEVQSSTLRGC